MLRRSVAIQRIRKYAKPELGERDYPSALVDSNGIEPRSSGYWEESP